MTEPHYLFSVVVVLESLRLWPKFQHLINLLKIYVWSKSQQQETAVNKDSSQYIQDLYIKPDDSHQ